MRRLLLLVLFVASSTWAQSEVVKFSATIANRNSDKITISGPNFKKEITLGKDGTFSDSFSVAPGLYEFFDGTEYTELYLKNGFDIQMTMDTKEFDESIVYTGKGAQENNFLAKKYLQEEALEGKMAALANNPEGLKKLFMDFGKSIKEGMEAPGMDPGLKDAFAAQDKANKEMQAKMQEQRVLIQKLVGTPAPDFNYVNHKGGTTKLSDLRGKYVYIDNWATWCGPCRAEIPHLQKIEEMYKGKNIEFVSISIDVKKDEQKWRDMVKDKSLGGVQLIADKDWNSDFIKAFGINSIPRFLIIGPDGTVVDADAPRPSMPVLQEKLNELLD